MHIKDWTKLVTIVGVLIATVVMGNMNKLDGQAVASIIAACLGYVFGNSHGVIEAKQAQTKEIL